MYGLAMAGTSLLALLDDIATLLDDVAVLTKKAASQTAGVLGDDLALNAEQVSGVHPERELPVVWAVAKGSAVNKLILVPAALGLSAFLPWAIGPLLMAGGGYLCFEGFEKVVHKLWPPAEDRKHADELLERVTQKDVDLVAFEKSKIKGAILTDFVLSAEIVVIALGSVQGKPLATQALVMTAIASLMTVGVYLFVAGIVKLDDAGVALTRFPKSSGWAHSAGSSILWIAPRLLTLLAVLGTCAMFLVGGGIWVHGIPPLSGWVHGAEHVLSTLPHAGLLLGSLATMLANAAVGLLCGGIAFFVVTAAKKLWKR